MIQQVNHTTHGLAACVFARDIDRGFRVGHALEEGTMWVRAHSMLHVSSSSTADLPLDVHTALTNKTFQIDCANLAGIQMPVGGFKQSGIGRELGEHYTNVESVDVNLGPRR
ncbi:hypothetical protein PAXINDRAFT_19623 [Paxillus involutus ATCC 200175]|uniref:Aldehyde dehydrogenase domain-containing protein n=1 Tax=Paxillus involutus ATCC 200175 TaxID=664439 RepID=A0A0C9SWK6_PAXIN|nr:hypothetical protein PAXINDRAFT_19623 [Paxillus involutus ATCC 200175]